MKLVAYCGLCGGLLMLCAWLSVSGRRPASVPTPASPPRPSLAAPTFTKAIPPATNRAASGPVPADPGPMAASTPKVPSALVSFSHWAERFLAGQADPAQGTALAENRRKELLALIQTDPEKALAWSAPFQWRSALPASITRYFEEQLDGRGDYFLAVGTDFARGRSVEYRSLAIGGRRYEAYVYGRRRNQISQRQIPVHGIAIDGKAAFSSDPVRILSSGEAAALEAGRAQPAPSACRVCGRHTQDLASAVAADLGGDVAYFCGAQHARLADATLAAMESAGGALFSQAISASRNNWTHGDKTVLYMRVNFPDDLTEPISEFDAYGVMDAVNTFYVESSYDQTALTTTVTPALTLPNTKAWYASTDPYYLLADAEQAAFDAGYDTANYDLEIACLGSVPGDNYNQWAGLAYVGGKGLWLQTDQGGGGPGVAAHELGHNYGLMHANFWDTSPSNSIYGAGTNKEYGNPYDTMGAALAGPYQFNARFKNTLGWLPDTAVWSVVSNGVYRIYPFDTFSRVPGCFYAAHVKRDFMRDYWLEFRQAFSGNRWLQNGLLLNWSPWDQSKGGTDLLDTTPDSIDGLDDAAVVIGRTYSDPEAGVHITPLARGSTGTNGWIDVQINQGGFWDNQPPELTVEIEMTNVAAGALVHFHATASDPDGDRLAYAWSFDDDTFSTNNLPWVARSWSVAGDHLVRCVVSDMKGGIASANALVTVGQSSGYRVCGQVVDTNGSPVEGVRIDTSSSNTTAHAVYTDSDGRYILPGQSGDISLYGFKYGFSFTNFTWTNPVTISSNTMAMDFVATPQTIVSLFLTTNAVSEADTNTQYFVLTRTGDTSTNLTLSLYVSGSATLGTDFRLTPSLSPGTNSVDIPPGTNRLVFALVPVNDSLVEGPETFTLTLLEDGTNVIGNLGEATLTILDDDLPNRPTVSVAAAAPSVPENGMDNGQFIFSRNGGTLNDLKVYYSIGGAATPGVDYTSLVGIAVIPAGQSSVAMPFQPLADQVLDPDETVIVTLQTNAAYVLGTATAQVTILDDELTTVTIVPTYSALAEPSGQGAFTVKRDGDVSASLTVYYTVGGTATSGQDYVPLSGAVTIPAGAASASFTVSALDDLLREGTESVIVTLTNNAIYNVGTPGSATLLITDNELPTVNVTASGSPLSEPGAAFGDFTVSRGSATGGDLAVNLAVCGTAISGVDYVPLDTPAIIPNGASKVDLPVIVFDDLYLEFPTDVRVFILPGTNYNVGSPSSARIQINDDDTNSVPAVSFTFSASSAPESLSPGISVSMTCTSAAPVSVHCLVIGGTAAKSDYTLPTSSLTFGPGEWAKTLPLQINDNLIYQSNRTIRLALYNPANATLGGIKIHTYTIVDDNLDSVSIAATAPGASEAGPVAGNFRISRGGFTNFDLPVQFQVTGTASAPTDYAPLGASVTIPAGAAFVDLPVRPNPDRTVEYAESVVVTLIRAPGSHLGSPSSAIVIITNSTVDSLPVVTITSTNHPYAVENGTNGQFVFFRNSTNGSLTVSFNLSGTAVAGADYLALPSTVVIPAGQYSASLPVAAIDDSLVEGERTLTAILNVTDTYRAASPAQATVIIQDNDQRVWMDVSDFNASEPGADTGEFTFTRFGTTNTPVRIYFSISGTASNGLDYVAISNSITIPAGNLSATLPIVVLDDVLVEGPETVTLTLQPYAAYALGQPVSGTVIIMDDEPMLTLTASVPDVTEGSQKPGVFTLTRSGDPKYEFTARLAVGGTATYGVDYPAFPTNIYFSCGVIAIDIPVYPTNELAVEGVETVAAMLLPDPAYTILSPSNALIMIEDAGLTPTPIVTITNPAAPAVSFHGTNANLLVSASVIPFDTNSVTLSWTQVSGPDGVTFGPTNELQTTVSLTNTGIYMIRLTADNGQVRNYAELTVALNADAWLATNVLHWAFDEGKGTNVADSSGSGHGGVLDGPPVWSTNGIAAGALQFAGTNDCAGATNPASFLDGLRAFSLSLWTRSDFTNRDHGLLCANDAGTNQTLALCTRGVASCGQETNVFEAAFSTSRGKARYISAGNALATPWQHWVLTWSNSLAPALFVNGQPDQPLFHHQSLSGFLTNCPHFIVGKDPADWPVSWQGLIDDVRVYARVLSPEEILLLDGLSTANQAPMVDAGSNTTVQITMPGTLAGTASDDGLPNPPGKLTTTWTLLQGPTNVVLPDIHSLTNTVWFTQTGEYVFRLIADDGEVQAYDDVTITVTEPTRVDISASIPDAAEFGPVLGEFTLTRDGDTNFDLTVYLNIGGIASNIVDYAELPGSVTFSNGSETVKLTVTPYLDHRTEGDQSVILTLVTNPAYTIGTGEATVTIHDSPYAMWTISHFTLEELTDPTLSDEGADFDHDGLVNLVEYAANLDPKSADTLRPLVTTLKPDAASGNTYVTLTFHRRLAPTDVAYEPSVSNDLIHWQSGADYLEELSATDDGNGVTETVVARVKAPYSGAANLFVTVKVWLKTTTP